MTEKRVVNTRPDPTPEMLAEADRLLAEGKEAMRRRQESWERSDTDGFLSQWAHGMTDELNRRKAEILRDGGCSLFRCLIDAKTGEVLADRVHSFPNRDFPWQVDRRWRLPEGRAAAAGRRWVPVGERSRVQRSLGLVEAWQWLPAYAKLTVPAGARSTGLSGCANAYVGTFRRDTDTQD